jgi:hypothetical protein
VIDPRIAGIDNLRKLSAHIRAEGAKGLGKELAKALEKALDPLEKEIAAEAERSMPSGYGPTLARSIRHRRTRRASAREASVRLATHAVGKRERRDLPALNIGVLRHPVFGRRKTWVAQQIRPAFYTRALDNAADLAERQVLVVLADLADRLAE